VQAGESTEELAARLEREARAIHDEDVASCRAMGGVGASVVPDGARVLTHCNAGALATAAIDCRCRHVAALFSDRSERGSQLPQPERTCVAGWAARGPPQFGNHPITQPNP
jgi:hypothetical protein